MTVYYKLGDTVSKERHVRAANGGGTYRWSPVAVIDFEDDEQVARLVELLGEQGWIPTKGHGLRDALREFAAPTPQPCTAAATVDEVVRPCELGGDHDGEHSVHHGRTRVTWGA